MADGLTKQLIETVKNKVPLNGGLSVKGYPVMGTLSDIQNFKIEDGVLKFRLGTKTVCADVGNKQFYFVKNFEFCGSEVVFGLSKQRCLYAWFDNFEEYMFTVRNASPFTQTFLGKVGGEDIYKTGELFTNGSKFWAYENQKYIMFFNDFGEIRVIVKDGGFRMNKEGQYIEVDIKDATNRVFDIPPSLKIDTRNVAPRITGEYRFARVNELGVVSELTEPQYLQDWKSVIATRIPIQTFQYQNLEVVKDDEHETGYKYIYPKNSGVLEMNGTDWYKPEEMAGSQTMRIPAMLIVVCGEGKITKATSVQQTTYGDDDPHKPVKEVKITPDSYSTQTLPKGIYLALMDDYKWRWNDGGQVRLMNSWDYDGSDIGASWIAQGVDTDWQSGARSFFEVNLKSVKYPQYNVNRICDKIEKKYMLRYAGSSINLDQFPVYNRAAYPSRSFSDVLFNNVAGEIFFKDKAKMLDTDFNTGSVLMRKSCIDGSFVFDIACDNMVKPFYAVPTKLYKLAGNDELYREAEQEHFTLSCNRGSLTYNNTTACVIEGQGKIYAIDDFCINYTSATSDRIIQPDPSVCRAYKYKARQSGYDSVYTMSDMDTLEFKEDFNTSVVVGSNYAFNESNGTLGSKYTDADFMANKFDVVNLNDRFAIWNDNKIIGVSQRFFAEYDNPHIPVYTGNVDKPIVRYSPIISLEYSNQRALRYELPLIRRAIRNPQFMCVSNGTVYSFEDNRLWYGDDYDFMMKGYAYLDGSLLVLIPYNEGALACTTSGLYYVNRENVQPVVNGRAIRAKYAGQTQVGGVVVADNKVYVVRTEITDSGARIETANIISLPIDELVFEGKIKTVCDKRQLYLADDYNVYGFDTEHGIWNLRYNYGDRKISDIFITNGKLGVLFDNQIDEKAANAFEVYDITGAL